MINTVSETKSQERIEKWDLARALLIFLVVLGHVIDGYTKSSANMRALFLFIYTFHIPCFLILDGMFSKHNVKEKRYRRIFSYIILYLFSKMLITLVRGIISHEFTFKLLSEDASPWYGLALFAFSMLTIFFSKFPKKWVLIFAIVLACFIGYDGSLKYELCIMRIVVFFPFFFLGYCLDPQELMKKLSAKWIRICSLIIVVTLLVICIKFGDRFYFLRALLTGTNSYNTFQSAYDREDLIFYGGLMRLAYYAIVFIVCMAVLALIPKQLPRFKFPSVIGQRSLQIYILHRPIVYVMYDAFKFNTFTRQMGISNWILIPIALGITLVLSLKFWEKPIRAIIYPKIQDDL